MRGRGDDVGEALLQLEDVRVLYGEFLAVDGVSFALAGGQLLGLIGPNGAGKTTILRASAGLLPVATGCVRVLGRDAARDPTHVGRHLGFAPDTPAVYEMLTVEQHLDFIGRCYDLTGGERAERIDFWLEQLWIADKRASKISTLSRGMRQRLAVARTLLSDPHVVLLDEPAAGLDPAGRIQFRQLLASLRDMGKAIIVSSHILADLAEYCTHIAFMERGRLRRFGTVAQIAGDADNSRTNYHVTLASAPGDLARRLEPLADVSIVSLNGEQLTLEYGATRDEAAELLQRLIQLGLVIAAFYPARPDLEQAYLRSGIAQVD